MLKYLRHSDITVRLALNVLLWLVLPKFSYESPTPIYPKRRTLFFGFLFLQVYIDIDNGEFDNSVLQKLFAQSLDNVEVKDSITDE